MKLNFNVPFLNLDGSAYNDPDTGQPILLSKLLKNALSYLTEGLEPLKGLDWMLKLEKEEVLDLDRADQDKLKRLISEGLKGLTLIGRGRLLEVFDAKEPHENEDKALK